jgi:hypothetical protein
MNYRNVHFRLDSGYEWGKGMDQEQSEKFHKEINTLFKEAGWEIKNPKFSSSCPEAVKEKNRLYLHPMDASGEVQEDLIPEVENILSKGTTFKFKNTDIYETLLDMSDDEYQQYLESKRSYIEADILALFKTKRKNLFVTNTSAVIQKVKEKYRIQRIQEHIGRSSDNLEWRYVDKVFRDMVNRDKFETAETKYGIGYRTKVVSK